LVITFALASSACRGERILKVHILSGSLVPLWQTMQDAVRRCVQMGKAGLTTRDIEMKVVRIEAEGQCFVGIKLPLEAMEEIKTDLKNLQDLSSGNAIRLFPTALSPAENIEIVSGR